MAILSKSEAKKILEKVLSFATAPETQAGLGGSTGGNIRYALNTVTTSGADDNLSLSVTSYYGKKSGTATINEFDDESLKKVVQRAEQTAKLAPENPEAMPLLGPTNFKDVPHAFSDKTANIDPEFRAKAAAASLKPCRKKGLTAAGFIEDYSGFNASMNSKGMFGYHRDTGVEFTVTVRTPDGTGSGWATRDYNDVSKLDTERASRIAMEKAERSVGAKAIEPGKYTVILEPAASVDLIYNMMGNFDARSADEGRSFLSKKGGGNKLGEKIVDERITLYSDPFDPNVPFSSWTGSGLPREKTYWIKDGVVSNMFYSRYWAKEKGKKPVPGPAGGVMLGGDASTEDLIKDTKKGILVTRLWYIRSVDPQTLLYTGLTRDGTFYIENGKIKYPIKNLRFNESPVIMLNNLEVLGKPQRIDGAMVPPMKIRDFTFTSLSDAV